MGLILTLILGGLAGWIASRFLYRDSELGPIGNVVVGVFGAVLANWLLAPLFDTEARLDTLSLSGFLMSVLGACFLLVIVNLLTRGRIR